MIPQPVIPTEPMSKTRLRLWLKLLKTSRRKEIDGESIMTHPQGNQRVQQMHQGQRQKNERKTKSHGS